MSFQTFCNICFTKQNVIKLCEEENEHIFNILITFTPCPELLNAIIYLCINCCNKLEEYDKFKQLFLINFVRFRYLYNEHRKKLEMHNEPNIEMQLKSFVDINVERASGTPLIENYEYIKDAVQTSKNTCREPDGESFEIQKNKEVSFSLQNNKSQNRTHKTNMNYENDSFNEEKNTPGSTVIKKCEPSFRDEFTNTDTFAASIPYSSLLHNESCNLASEDKYFETEDIKLEKGEPYFSDEGFKEFTKADNVATSIPYCSSRYDESCNLATEQKNFETVDIKIEKDEPNPDRFEEIRDKNVSDTVGSVIPCHKPKDDDTWNLSSNSTNCETEDTTIEEEPSDEANKATKIRDICKVCQKGFRAKNYLEVHMRIHTGERPFPCDECQKTFVNNSKLIAHKRIHSGEKPYNCDDCDIRFRTSSALKIHKRTHTGEKPYSCDECNKTFRHRTNLLTHKRIHSGEKPYKCDECDMSFTQLSILNTHKRMHTGERPYSCDKCNKSFTSSGSLIIHKRNHSEDKPYKCDECGLGFIESRAFSVHMRKHTGEKPYQCDECDKTFADKSSFMRHKRVHTGEKRHKCDECGMTFIESRNLKIHKRKHTGEKPYSCDECHKTFAAIPTLITHKRIHTGEKPYKCDECGLGFTQQSNLKRHKRLHTGEKP